MHVCFHSAVAIFTPTIIKTMWPHLSTVQLQLRTVPPYVAGAACTLLIPFLAWKTQRRGIYMLICAPITATGYIMFVATLNPQVRYGACFIIMMSCFSFGARKSLRCPATSMAVNNVLIFFPGSMQRLG
jgi:MFS-type transporter involved in bile tolerance (Atg22 family)